MERGNKEVMGEVLSIGETGKAGKYIINKVLIRKLDDNAELEVSVFRHDEEEEFGFQSGDEVMMPLYKKDYKGKPQFSCFLSNIEPVANETIPEKPLPKKPASPKKETISTKEKEPDDMEWWLTYRQRVNELVEIFKDRPNADTSLSSAILGLREHENKR